LIEPAWQVADVAEAGARISGPVTPTMAAKYPVSVLPLYNAQREKNWLVFEGGTNDCLDSVDAATLAARTDAYLTQAIADGFSPIVWTITPSTHYTGAQDTVRLTENARRKVVYAGRIADVAAALPDPTDLTYYVDGLHPWTTAAQVIISHVVLNAANLL
jgi:hypothetical protein